MFIRWLDDGVYYGLMTYLYGRTGVTEWFLPGEYFTAPLSAGSMLALRYGLWISTMNEVRRWLTGMGWHTDLISYYLTNTLR